MTEEERIRTMVRRVVYRAVGRPVGKPTRRRALVTEQDLRDVRPGDTVVVRQDSLVTPLARQTALERRVALVGSGAAAEPGATTAATPTTSTPPAAPARSARTVALGADHGGFELKEMIKAKLEALGYGCLDCGTDTSESVDYPDFALAVAQLVAQGRAWRGIVVDGAGIGSCMAANKVPGVRAAMCYDEATAVNSRSHNDANVLTLGAGMIPPALGWRIVALWLETEAESGRHQRRVGKIMDIERRFARRA